MPTRHVVRQGECVATLAHRYHIPRAKIWAAPENRDLAALRDQFVLLPGDEVVIPDPVTKSISVETAQRHVFVLKSEKVYLRVRLLEADVPLANEAYHLTIGDESRAGQTDGDGRLEEKISAGAPAVRLEIHGRTLLLRLGHLDPPDKLTGIQARLNNLGFDTGPVDGDIGPMTRRALRRFQRKEHLPVAGEPNAATADKLKSRHGS